jgi:nucleotide-binding universal stress UspA family protein
MTTRKLSPDKIATEKPLRLGCRYDSPLSPDKLECMQRLGALLGGAVERLPAFPESRPRVQQPEDEEGLDLLVYWERKRAWWQRLLGWSSAPGVVAQSQASVLVLREPRWPLRRFLLIMRAHETDDFALNWVGRLARKHWSELFVLPIVPPVPVMQRHFSIPLQAEMLLAPGALSGAEIRRMDGLCARWGIPGTVLLHDGEPQRRIQWAAEASDCDLIVIGAEPFPWIQRRLFGELERPLLRRTDRPVLVARGPRT